MQFAIQTPPERTTFSGLRDLWQAADELGFAAAFTFDHLVPLNPGERPGATAAVDRSGAQLEGWTALAALAAGTRNLQVGTLVSGVTYRHPSMLAKMAVTLDHITNGRAILGLGAAWHADEHARFGIDFPDVGERMTRLDEALTMFHLLCNSEGAPVNYEGRYYRLNEAVFDPLPVRRTGIPVLVGGSGPRLKRIAARHAAWFNSFSAPWEWPAMNSELDRLLSVGGRDPRDLLRTAFVFVELSGDAQREDQLVATFQTTRGGTDDEVRRRVLVGSPEQMAATLRSYADAGIDMAILNLRPPHGPVLAGLVRFAAEVIPAVG